MKLVYTGPHADLEIPSADLVVLRDVPTEVPDALAKELIKRDDFKRTETPAEKQAREKAEAEQAEQDKAADEARARVAEKQAKANGSGS